MGWADSIARRALTLATGASLKTSRILMLTAAAGAIAMIGYQNAERTTAIRYQSDEQEPAVYSKTIVIRQAATPAPDKGWEESDTLEEENEADSVPSNVASSFVRAVRTVRFFAPAPTPAQSIAGLGEQIPTATAPSSKGRTASATANVTYRGEGIASWYGSDFHGGKTANGERYDMNGISAAHRTMPLPSYARVTNLDNGRSIIVRINNRGPYVHRRIVDVSVGAAKALDFYKKGTTHVRVEFVGRAPIEGSDDRMLLATLRTGEPASLPAEVMLASAKASPVKDSGGTERRSASKH
jgi:rare lipoprotein A (peptidoglycan hydrolase)